MLIVEYRSRGRSARTWKVLFDLDSQEANARAALEYAWKNNAAILGAQEAITQ